MACICFQASCILSCEWSLIWYQKAFHEQGRVFRTLMSLICVNKIFKQNLVMKKLTKSWNTKYAQYYVTNLLNLKITIIIKSSYRASQLNNIDDLWELWPNSTPKRSHKSYTTDCSLMYILWYPLVEIDNVLSTLSEKIEDIHKPGIYVSLHLFARVHSLISIFQYVLSLQFWII